MHHNEIRDYLERAPKRRLVVDGRTVNTMHARLTWLADIARGPLDDRINRRAAPADPYRPFSDPVASAIRRNARKLVRKGL